MAEIGPGAYNLVSVVGVISALSAVVLGLAFTAEAAGSITAVMPIVVTIAAPGTDGLLVLLGDDILLAALSCLTCAGAEGAARGAPTCGRYRVLPASGSRRSYWSITARSIHFRVGHVVEPSRIRASALYWGLKSLGITMSTSFGSTGRSTLSSSWTI